MKIRSAALVGAARNGFLGLLALAACTIPQASFADVDLSSNLISVWLSDDSGLTDDLHGGNDLTDVNTVTFLDDGGKNGDAASFASTSTEYLESTSLTGWISGSNPFSYSGWFKVPGIASGQGAVLLDSTISGTGSRYFTEVQLNDAGKLKFEAAWLSAGTQGVEFFSTTTDLDDNEWHHFVVTGENDGVARGKIYIDGALDATSSHPFGQYSFGSQLQRFRIGATYNWLSGEAQGPLTGTLHQVAAWKKALAPEEVSALYNAGDGIYYNSFATSTTWQSGTVHKVSGTMVVPEWSTLTIEPGAIVKFDTATTSSLVVNGTLNAIGTAASTSYFTSWKDDLIGGDSNGDATSTTPTSGDWGGIQVNAGGSANFGYSFVRYGGVCG